MKTRIGFVSNSSGTSFIIFGVFCSREKWLEKLLEFQEVRDLIDEEIEQQDEIDVKNLETYLKKAEYLMDENNSNFLYNVNKIVKDADSYNWDGDILYWFGVQVDTHYAPPYKLEYILEQIQLAKDIANKYGFEESKVEMGSVFDRE